MNVHDSERMAGLLDQAGFEATLDETEADVVVINTCSVRERAEEKLYTRLGELRQLAAEQGHHPIVAVAGCVAQQEGRGAAEAIAGRRRRDPRHAGDSPPADAGRAGGGRAAAARRRDAVRGCLVSARRGPSRRSGQGLRHDHRRVQRVLQLLRRALHARERADAAQGRHRGRSAGGGRDRASRSAAARSDCESLRGAGRSRLRLHGAARSDPRDSRASIGSGSRALIRGT